MGRAQEKSSATPRIHRNTLITLTIQLRDMGTKAPQSPRRPPAKVHRDMRASQGITSAPKPLRRQTSRHNGPGHP